MEKRKIYYYCAELDVFEKKKCGYTKTCAGKTKDCNKRYYIIPVKKRGKPQ